MAFAVPSPPVPPAPPPMPAPPPPPPPAPPGLGAMPPPPGLPVPPAVPTPPAPPGFGHAPPALPAPAGPAAPAAPATAAPGAAGPGAGAPGASPAPPGEPTAGDGWATGRVKPEELGRGVWLGSGKVHHLRVPEPLKAQVPIRLSCATLEETRAWILKNPVEVEVDGKSVPCGVLAESAGKVVVQFRLPPGEHSLVVSSLEHREGGAAGTLPPMRMIYVSQKLEVKEKVAGSQPT